MTIFKDSFETTIGRSFHTPAIIKHIKEAIVVDNIDKNNLGVDHVGDIYPLFILGNKTSETNIPLFDHPILINNGSKKYICTDIRPQLKVMDEDVTYTAKNIGPYIRNKSEYDFQMLMTILALQWISEGTNPARMHFYFAGAVYNSVISQTLARLFGLNPREQSEVAVLADAFYQSLFLDETEYTDDLKSRMMTYTIKNTKLPVELVTETYDKISPMANIEDFCKQLETVTGNIRLSKFDFPKLLTAIANIWFSRNSKKLIPIALEYPPAWIAMVWSCLNDRTYKTTMLTKTAENAGKRLRGTVEEFNRNIKQTMDDFMVDSYLVTAIESLMNTVPDIGEFE